VADALLHSAENAQCEDRLFPPHPLPAADVFNILHWREAIVDSLLCCDLCGFHIPRYVENFVSAARSLRDVKLVERKPVPEAFTPHGHRPGGTRHDHQAGIQRAGGECGCLPRGHQPGLHCGEW
jgi:hypothetical protein